MSSAATPVPVDETIPDRDTQTPVPGNTGDDATMYSCISSHQVLSIWAMDDVDLQLKTLGDICGISEYGESLRTAILLDLYLTTILIAKDWCFCSKKASVWFSILRSTHDLTMKPDTSMDDCFDHFRSELLKHTLKPPPKGTNLFSLDDVRLMTDYMVKTYFRHYKLHKICFTRPQQKEKHTFVAMVQTAAQPPLLPPLSAAMTLEDHQKKVAAEAAALEAEETAKNEAIRTEAESKKQRVQQAMAAAEGELKAAEPDEPLPEEGKETPTDGESPAPQDDDNNGAAEGDVDGEGEPEPEPTPQQLIDRSVDSVLVDLKARMAGHFQERHESLVARLEKLEKQLK
eukprot:Rmarinus@m.15252